MLKLLARCANCVDPLFIDTAQVAHIYNVNAPVSIDGGTGFDKLVILGTEFEHGKGRIPLVGNIFMDRVITNFQGFFEQGTGTIQMTLHLLVLRSQLQGL